MKEVLKGNGWQFGDNVDTDQIIPGGVLVTMDNSELAKARFREGRPGLLAVSQNRGQ